MNEVMSPEEPIDILVPTYNSGKYLDEALTAIKKCIPVNRIIAADHYSKDETLNILRNHGAEVYFENQSLGYARQLLIDKASTDVIMMLDSDVIIEGTEWYSKALGILGDRVDGGEIVGAVALIPKVNPPIQLKKYTEFWWRIFPSMKRNFFVTHSTLILKDSVRGIRIPAELYAAEDVYVWLYMKRRGYVSRTMEVEGIHHFVRSENKGEWMGANLRILQKFVGKAVLPFVIRNVMVYPALALVAALFTKDANVLTYNLERWYGYLQGYFFPQKFCRISR